MNLLSEIDTIKAKYANPFTGFGFKKIFEEAGKSLLIDFLNAILQQPSKTVDL